MRRYLDKVMVVAANDEGEPDVGNAAALVAAGVPYTQAGKTYFLCRVRAAHEADFPVDAMLKDADDEPGRSGGRKPEGAGQPGGASFATPAEFRSARPDLWAKFGMSERVVTVTSEGG